MDGERLLTKYHHGQNRFNEGMLIEFITDLLKSEQENEE